MYAYAMSIIRHKSVENCSFCQIVNGQQAAVVYRDADLVAVLDQYAEIKPRVLVIPREHVSNLFDLSPAAISHLVHVSVLLAMALATVAETDKLALVQVAPLPESAEADFHFHLHLVPYYANQPAWLTITPDESLARGEVEPIVVLLQNHLRQR
jgi:histidine triad (HIT) family protein